MKFAQRHLSVYINALLDLSTPNVYRVKCSMIPTSELICIWAHKLVELQRASLAFAIPYVVPQMVVYNIDGISMNMTWVILDPRMDDCKGSFYTG